MFRHAQRLATFVYGGQPPEPLEAAGILPVEGDRAVAAQFATLFPLPPGIGEEEQRTG